MNFFLRFQLIYYLAEVLYNGVLMALLRTRESVKLVEGVEVAVVAGVSKIRLVRETVRHLESK